MKHAMLLSVRDPGRQGSLTLLRHRCQRRACDGQIGFPSARLRERGDRKARMKDVFSSNPNLCERGDRNGASAEPRDPSEQGESL